MGQRIAVLGTGANGSCVAADLTRAGHDVTLIDQWPAHVDAMRANGLHIAMPDEDLQVRVTAHHLCDVCALNQTFDIVFLAVKAYDTRWLCEFIKPYLADDGLLIGLQNAMTAETIAEIVGGHRTIGCVVELSSEVFTPGRVQRNTPPKGTWFGVGALAPAMADRVPEIVELLRHVGKVSVTDDVLAAKWMKLIVNTMCLGPTALLGGTVSEGVRMPGMRELLLQVGAEALDLGRALGFKVQPIMGMKPEDVHGSNQLLEKMLDKITADIGPRARDCVLQDHLKGRYSEVDLINGLVVEESARLGRSAPANAIVVEMTRRIQSGELTPGAGNLALVQAMLSERAAAVH
jgi:2-dehydropantoate 2-reductase